MNGLGRYDVGLAAASEASDDTPELLRGHVVDHRADLAAS
jgi:hypothetical protein